MRFLDYLGLVFYNLGRRKGRVALTAIGVVIGTAAVVVLVALASGLQRNATRQFSQVGNLTLITVYPKYGEGGMGMMPMVVGSGGSGQSQTKLLTPQAIAEISAIDGVAQVIPRDTLRGGARLVAGKMETYPFIMAYDAQDLNVFNYQMKEGVAELKRGEALVGESLAKGFNDPRWRPGQPQPEQPEIVGKQLKLVVQKYSQDGTMTERVYSVRIAGIIKQRMDETDYGMIMRMDDLTQMNEWLMGKRINRNKEGYDMFYVKATDTQKTTEVSKQINDLGYQAYSQLEFVQSVNNFYTIIQIVFGGIGAIALLVAAIGIANTMTMAILERTREIGLMKAVGATNRDVMSIFLGEAGGIGLIGGIGGVALAWGLAQIINVLAASYLSNPMPYGGEPPGPAAYIAPWLPLFALVFSSLVGIISGLYPALRAATMVPVMALKYE